MVPFDFPLKPGRFLKRYKRFFVDIELDEGMVITAHCVNTGAMVGLLEPGTKVWVMELPKDPKRKLNYRWELIEINNTFIGVNTSKPNKIVESALHNKIIPSLKEYSSFQREISYAGQSRIDFLLKNDQGKQCYVEVKNVYNKRYDEAYFPDCVTSRGLKHLENLADICAQGHQAVMLYIIQRADCSKFCFAADFDAVYAQKALQVRNQGVIFLAYDCTVTPHFINLRQSLDICW